jgi:hypothetical protein
MAYLYHVAGGTQMSMIAVKPRRLLGTTEAPVGERVVRSLAASVLTAGSGLLRALPRRVARRG